MEEFLTTLDGIIWGKFMLIPLLLGTGIWLTIRLGGVQFLKLGPALSLALFRRSDADHEEGDVSHYQALATALAATVGVGNIAGVGTAIHLGGPGALFWMWLSAIFGMAAKYSEAFMGVRFRTLDANGEVSGGPQYYLQRAIPGGLGKFLALFFAIAAVIASFGIGNMTQSNSVAAAMHDTFGISPTIVGAVLVVLTALVLLGGIKSISRVTSAFVPLMIIFYVVAGFVVLAINYQGIIPALQLVFTDAFTGTAAAGGFAGAALAQAIQFGIARGVFSNESGMGSAAIVAAAAKTKHPVRQGLVSMTQTFIDTIIVVSMTGLVILTTGVWQSGKTGAALTAQGFSTGLPGTAGGVIVALALIFFAYSTVLGWAYYGERNVERLVGVKGVLPYRLVFSAIVFVGATMELSTVWTFSDIANGLMALPNLVGLLICSGLIARETKTYLKVDPTLHHEPEVSTLDGIEALEGLPTRR
ncbi:MULTISPECIES: alanine/glycine:cation symporter family protein [unclassified Luteococcus]|uniref:alanine/glycine:cation symporter family protein n=1 Tax=unclassified Luteococcus TaxID=2639923 RepID=UPI00313AB3A4